MKFSGSKLRAIREKKGLSAAKVAIGIKVARTTVTMWESGESQPNSDKLIALSVFLKAPMRSFFEDDINKLANM